MATTSEQHNDLLTDRLLTAHRLLVEQGNGAPSPIRSLQENAIQAFERLGFPTTKSESWKYTPVEKWLPNDLVVGPAPSTETVSLPESLERLDGYKIVTKNGVFDPDRSTIPAADTGVVITSLAHAVTDYEEAVAEHLGRYASLDTEVFAALNTAFLRDGLFIMIPANTVVDRPIYVFESRESSGGRLEQARTLMIAGDHARAEIVEWLAPSQGVESFENPVSEFVIGPGADVRHGHVFDRGMKSSLVNTMNVYQRKDSRFRTNHVTLTGSLVRHNLNFLPDAEGCETHLFGLVAARGNMHVDIQSFVDHAKPHSFSNELYKCLLDGASTGVFNGRVLVRQDAQQINAYQSNRSILLSDDARMYSKPELEIYADDVKCSHGATTGRLDSDAIFYLRSRGLTESAARLLLLQSFAAEVVHEFENDDVEELVMERLIALLKSGSKD